MSAYLVSVEQKFDNCVTALERVEEQGVGLGKREGCGGVEMLVGQVLEFLVGRHRFWRLFNLGLGLFFALLDLKQIVVELFDFVLELGLVELFFVLGLGRVGVRLLVNDLGDFVVQPVHFGPQCFELVLFFWARGRRFLFSVIFLSGSGAERAFGGGGRLGQFLL
ncbi:hypothetical protein BpHYR1_043636 [Brachionus plicatilis]|uniref:Uncharacterized protein n=1 Tax=Brachionus plicatilis TaxID=10195 RepID=A0A3M7RLG7_BRAPC|nr:hypothetical protein BpHYR1_043636 [Brachionus plicatilis]